MTQFLPSARAKKQQELQTYLLENPQSGRLKDLRKLFSPTAVKIFLEKELLHTEKKEVSRSAAHFQKERQDKKLLLNEEQAVAVTAICEKIGKENTQPVLLEGVTGSGKTEVYLKVIEEALIQGKTAIMLVPEISLTPQVTDRFISRFGDKVAILHSGLSDGEKYDEWRKVERGEAQVVVGARSAIFAPLTNIGAIDRKRDRKSTRLNSSHP